MLTLFGGPPSLYTAKARSYLRKAGIAYQEVLTSDPRWAAEVMPAIGRFMIPVVLAPDGSIIQDSVAIIDWCEAQGLSQQPAYPATPLLKVTALALEMLGSEGLVRAAMHYRWSFRARHERFINREFGLALRAAGLPDAEAEAKTLKMMDFFNAYLPLMGIDEATIPAIEAAYTDLMLALDAHFRRHPHALGGVPTMADYGLTGSLWAHLGRDPVPSELMKCEAPSLFRWVERMQATDRDVPEFPHYPAALPADDTPPETLLPVLKLMAQDYLPEIEAMMAGANAFLAETPVEPGAPARYPARKFGFAPVQFTLRGTPVTGLSTAYKLWMMQRLTDAFAAAPAADQARIRAYFETAGLAPLLTLSLPRRIDRVDHREVWGAPNN